MFSPTVSVSNSEKCWNTMPMPSLRAAAGLPISTGSPFPADLAFVGSHRAVDDFHQRRLARAVFAEHRVDFTRFDDQASRRRWP